MGILSQHEFMQEIRANSFRPVYVFAGSEGFLRRQALKTLRDHALKPEVFSFNYSEFSLRTVPLREMLNAAQTFPFGSPRRLVIATGLDAIAEKDQDDLLDYVAAPSGKSILVLDVEDLDRRTGFYRALRDKAVVVEFTTLSGLALVQWAEQFLRGRGVQMTPSALKKLIALAGPDTQSLSAEIEKLALYSGAGKMIPDSAVDDLVHSSRQYRIFDLTDAIGRKDRKAALQLLESLMESGEPAGGIVALIGRQFRQILIVKELQGSGKTVQDIEAALQLSRKAAAFVIEILLRQARSFDWDTAKWIYTRIAEVDWRIKSSKVDPKVILEGLICSI